MAFGGTDQSSAQSQAQGSLNASGWVVGKGNANGGKSSMDVGGVLPWYGWVSLGVIALAWYRKRKKR
jgi:hypothetical protein